MNYFYKKMKSPVGELTLIASKNGLTAILWEKDRPTRVRLGELVLDEKNFFLIEAEEQLKEYFQGKRKEFNLKLDPVGTEFQQRVWKALLAIPFGETRSYGELANALGNPKASRAVGAANGKNPLSIVVPCHRVIGANGKLTGFAGGLKNKSILLELESV